MLHDGPWYVNQIVPDPNGYTSLYAANLSDFFNLTAILVGQFTHEPPAAQFEIIAWNGSDFSFTTGIVDGGPNVPITVEILDPSILINIQVAYFAQTPVGYSFLAFDIEAPGSEVDPDEPVLGVPEPVTSVLFGFGLLEHLAPAAGSREFEGHNTEFLPIPEP